jgi:hypothetical protein
MEVSMTTQLPIGKSGQHGFTLVDDEDADIVGSRTISRTTVGKGKGKNYCIISSYYSKGKNTYLHRLIMERVVGRPLLKKEVVDHRDGNGFNNQRSNLRVTTQRKNCQNRIEHREDGNKQAGKWMAYINVDGKQKYLGLFPTELEAHQAYQDALASL